MNVHLYIHAVVYATTSPATENSSLQFAERTSNDGDVFILPVSAP